MKKTAFILMSFFLGTGIIFYSCDKKQSTISNTDDNTHLKRDVYLDRVYPEGYLIERSKSFTVDGIPMITYEIKPVGKQKTGYIIEHGETYELLYFVEYNYKTQKIKVNDFVMDERKIVNWNVSSTINFNQNAFNLFTLIQQHEEVQSRARRPFIGWGCGDDYYSPNACSRTCCYYVGWVNTGDCCEVTCDTYRCR